MTTLRVIGLGLALLGLPACALHSGRADSDALEPARVALAWIEHEMPGKLPVIVSKDVSEGLAAAIATERKVVAERAMPAGVPAGYFLLTSMRMSGKTARVTGWLGPALRQPPALSAGCGTGFDIPSRRSNAGWEIADRVLITNC